MQFTQKCPQRSWQRSAFSINSQIREAKKKAGAEDVKIYADEDYCGEYLEGPGMNQLIQYLKIINMRKLQKETTILEYARCNI